MCVSQPRRPRRRGSPRRTARRFRPAGGPAGSPGRRGCGRSCRGACPAPRPGRTPCRRRAASAGRRARRRSGGRGRRGRVARRRSRAATRQPTASGRRIARLRGHPATTSLPLEGHGPCCRFRPAAVPKRGFADDQRGVTRAEEAGAVRRGVEDAERRDADEVRQRRVVGCPVPWRPASRASDTGSAARAGSRCA